MKTNKEQTIAKGVEKGFEEGFQTVMVTQRQERTLRDNGASGLLGIIRDDYSDLGCKSPIRRCSKECMSPFHSDFEAFEKYLEPANHTMFSPLLPSPTAFWRTSYSTTVASFNSSRIPSSPSISSPFIPSSNISSSTKLCSDHPANPEEEPIEVYDFRLTTRHTNNCATSQSNYAHTESEFNSSDSHSTIIHSELSHISLAEHEERFEVAPNLIERTYESSLDSGSGNAESTYDSEGSYILETSYDSGSSTSDCSRSDEGGDNIASTRSSENTESTGESSYFTDSEVMHQNNQILHWILTGERKAYSSDSTVSSYTYCGGDIVTLPSEEEVHGQSDDEGENEEIVAPTGSTHEQDVTDRTAEISGSGTKMEEMNLGCGKDVVGELESVDGIGEEVHSSEKSCGEEKKEAWLESQKGKDGGSSSASEVKALKSSGSTQDTASRSEKTEFVDDNILGRNRRRKDCKKRDIFRKIGRLFGRCLGMCKKLSSP